MKTYTHTPGAWKVSSCSDGREIVSHSCGITFPIAEVCDGLGKANGLKEAQANARLIAAAPELLEALTGLHDFMLSRESYKLTSLYAKTITAIRKAEGRI